MMMTPKVESWPEHPLKKTNIRESNEEAEEEGEDEEDHGDTLEIKPPQVPVQSKKKDKQKQEKARLMERGDRDVTDRDPGRDRGYDKPERQAMQDRTKPNPPGPVRSLTATAIGCTQVKLSWRPPADDGGFQVTDYFYRIYIQYRVNYDECCRIVPTKGTECLIDGLEQLKEYRFMVAAVNTLGIQGNFKSLQLSTKPSTIKSSGNSESESAEEGSDEEEEEEKKEEEEVQEEEQDSKEHLSSGNSESESAEEGSDEEEEEEKKEEEEEHEEEQDSKEHLSGNSESESAEEGSDEEEEEEKKEEEEVHEEEQDSKEHLSSGNSESESAEEGSDEEEEEEKKEEEEVHEEEQDSKEHLTSSRITTKAPRSPEPPIEEVPETNVEREDSGSVNKQCTGCYYVWKDTIQKRSKTTPTPCISITSEQKQKLNEYFDNIVKKVSIDFNNQEIKEMQDAVYKMLERVENRINERAVFSIARIERAGSMADKTSIWKFDRMQKPFIEFDFLGILEHSIEYYSRWFQEQRCPGCIELVKAPVDLEQVRRLYDISEYNAETLEYRKGISECDDLERLRHRSLRILNKYDAGTLENTKNLSILALIEINTCLALSCYSLSVGAPVLPLTIAFEPASSEHEDLCKECTIDMPTGTLSVNTSVSVGKDCSMIFQWTSKAKNLSAPDKLLFSEPQQITSLPIYVDFLPALESLKPKASGAGDGYEHDYFIVPKKCNTCRLRDGWRKSRCMAEINEFVKNASAKHRKCYQIIKYLNVTGSLNLPSYHVKTVALHHSKTCSNTTDDCAECVMKIFEELRSAYELKQLNQFHEAKINLLRRGEDEEYGGHEEYERRSYIEKTMEILCSLSDTDTSETIIQRIQEIPSPLENMRDYMPATGPPPPRGRGGIVLFY